MTFHEQLQQLGFDSYAEYLESDHWQEFRKKYYSKRPYKCFVTGDRENIDLHHIDYSHLGNERLKDVVPLRHDIHGLVHILVRENRLLLEDAHIVLKKAYKQNKLPVVNIL